MKVDDITLERNGSDVVIRFYDRDQPGQVLTLVLPAEIGESLGQGLTSMCRGRVELADEDIRAWLGQ